MVDYSKLSNEDLINLKNGNYSAITNEGLLILSDRPTTTIQGGVAKRSYNPLPAIGRFVGDIGKGLAQGVSSIGIGLGKNVVNPYIRPLFGKKPLSEEELNQVYGFLDDEPVSNTQKVSKFAGELAPYLLLPEAKIAEGAGLGTKLLNMGATGAYQGSVVGGVESLKNKGVSKDLAGDIIGGSLVGGAIGAGVPLTIAGGQQTIKLLPKTGGFFSKTLGRTKPETLEQAVKPNSKALDMDAAQAQQELMNTAERVRNDYNELLTTKGDKVGELLEQLPEEVVFKADDVANDVNKTFGGYSLSGTERLNPALNSAKKEIGQIDDLLYGSQTDRLNKFQNEIDSLKFPDAKKEVTRGGHNGHFWTKDAASLNNVLVQADRDFNLILSDIKRKVAENPKILSNSVYIEKLENNLGNILKHVPLEAQTPYYEKLYSAIDKGNILEKANTTITPKELYDINKNISNMVQWDKPEAVMKNNALEQIYGQNANRISELSPALAAANKEYSRLMDFQKNEGLRRILRQGDNIDAASSALKNYNSTITKGNTGRNVQELEKTLVENGYEPFIDDIDDINAAQDLLNVERTGDSSIANAAKLLTRPVLRAARWANRRNLPAIMQRYVNIGERNIPPMLIYSNEILDDEY